MQSFLEENFFDENLGTEDFSNFYFKYHLNEIILDKKNNYIGLCPKGTYLNYNEKD